MTFLHFDEAKPAAEDVLVKWLAATSNVERALLVSDLFGTLRLVLWSEDPPETLALDAELRLAGGSWWSGEVLDINRKDEVTRVLYAESLEHGQRHADEPRLIVLDRHRSRTAWFVDETEPLWAAPQPGPPIVVFYSFKGGLGRTTALAAFAVQRARASERVCILDLDLDSPGVGRLLASDPSGLTAQWGVVDFLIESTAGESPLADYYHRCDRVAGPGEIAVFPAGIIDHTYPDKLARVDLEEGPPAKESVLAKLLERVRDELKPQWILLDARTGISESAGRLLSGIAHLHVLLASTQDQSWQGSNIVLDRLGKTRVEAGSPQADVILIQSMVPAGEAGRIAREAFMARAEREFTDRYYAEVAAGEDDMATSWTTRDSESQDAPHMGLPLDYDTRLASFEDIADIADQLCVGGYAAVGERILGRFVVETED
jgi:cellulose biosynthesis protein BcsQ